MESSHSEKLQKSSNGVKASQTDKVKVILRIRPSIESEDPQQFITVDQQQPQPRLQSESQQNNNQTTRLKTITLNKPGNNSYMKFAHVQTGGSTQLQIYEKVQETVSAAINEGVNGTIFAYGQTGAGKTYTMIGDCPQSSSSYIDNRHAITNEFRGIIPRTLEMIIEEVKKRKDTRLSISFYEIYLDRIFDLLSTSVKPLDIREHKNGDISIPGLLSVQITNINEGLHHLAEGIANRVTSATQCNIKSSRSHSVFQLKLQRLVQNTTNEQDFSVQTTLMRIVDLAGSEKFNVPHNISPQQRDIRMQQLKSINGSLSKLGHCISALTSQGRTHVPFRQTKLTRVLSESLMGSGKIRLIVCISPSMSAMNETISTLQFANQVKKAVFQRPVTSSRQGIKKYVDLEQHQAVLQQLQNERKARLQLEQLLVHSNFSGSGASSNQLLKVELKLLKDNDALRQEVLQLRQQLKIHRVSSNLNTLYTPKANPLRKATSKIQRGSLSPLKMKKKTTINATSPLKSRSPSPFSNLSKSIKTNQKYVTHKKPNSKNPFEVIIKKHFERNLYPKNKRANGHQKTESSHSIYQKSQYDYDTPHTASNFEFEDKSVDVHSDSSRKINTKKTGVNGTNKAKNLVYNNVYAHNYKKEKKSPLDNPFIQGDSFNGNEEKQILQVSFQQKIRRFMDKSTEKDVEVDEKIKKKLQQIKKEIKMEINDDETVKSERKIQKKELSFDNIVSQGQIRGLWND